MQSYLSRPPFPRMLQPHTGNIAFGLNSITFFSPPSAWDLNCRRHYLLHKNLLPFLPPPVRAPPWRSKFVQPEINTREKRILAEWSCAFSCPGRGRNVNEIYGGCKEKFIVFLARFLEQAIPLIVLFIAPC